MTPHVVVLGASRGVGYHTLLNLLKTPADITLLLRNPDVFASDPAIAPSMASGRVTVVTGDATKEDDVARLFKRPVDTVFTSIGGVPHITMSGFKLNDPTICTRSTLALLRVLATLPAPPRLVATTSMGIGPSHNVMPLALRVLYPWMLSGPHADKEGMEYLLSRAAKYLPDLSSGLPDKAILSPEDAQSVPEQFLDEVIVVRPALLTDGEETGKIRAAEDLACYTISRKDTGRFVAEAGMGTEWVNRAAVIGY